MNEFISAIFDDYITQLQRKMELVAEEFDINRLKVSKILITIGDYKNPLTRQVREMRSESLKTGEISVRSGIASCTVTSLLPYEKTVYNMDEISTAAKKTMWY